MRISLTCRGSRCGISAIRRAGAISSKGALACTSRCTRCCAERESFFFPGRLLPNNQAVKNREFEARFGPPDTPPCLVCQGRSESISVAAGKLHQFEERREWWFGFWQGEREGGTPCGSSKPRPHERRLQEWSGQLEASTDDADHVRVFFASATVFLATAYLLRSKTT